MFFRDQMYIFGYKTKVFIQNMYVLVKFFGKKFIFSVKSTIFCFFPDHVHSWVQNYSFYPKMYTLVKFFGKNLIFSVKSTMFLSGPKFLGTKLHFLSKICTFSSNCFQKLIFWSKKYNFFGFSGPNVHFWVQNYSFYPKFVHFSEIVWQKLNF